MLGMEARPQGHHGFVQRGHSTRKRRRGKVPATQLMQPVAPTTWQSTTDMAANDGTSLIAEHDGSKRVSVPNSATDQSDWLEKAIVGFC